MNWCFPGVDRQLGSSLKKPTMRKLKVSQNCKFCYRELYIIRMQFILSTHNAWQYKEIFIVRV